MQKDKHNWGELTQLFPTFGEHLTFMVIVSRFQSEKSLWWGKYAPENSNLVCSHHLFFSPVVEFQEFIIIYQPRSLCQFWKIW